MLRDRVVSRPLCSLLWAIGFALGFVVSTSVGQDSSGSESAALPELIVSADGLQYALHGMAGQAFHTTANEVGDLRGIALGAIPGWVATWEEQVPGEGAVSSYAISLDGRHVDRVRRTSYDINLRYAQFDPAVETPSVPAVLTRDADSELYIVQFITQPLEAYRAAVRRRGGRIFDFLSNHAYAVRLDAAAKAQVAALPFVRWVGPFHPAYKLEEELLEQVTAGVNDGQPRRYSIMLFERGFGPRMPVARRITELGGEAYCASEHVERFEALLTLDQVLEVARMDEVMFIDEPGEIGNDMNIARSISGANYVETLEGFTGQGVRGEVFDEGILETHVAFKNLEIHHENSAITDHGTKVYGTVFGDGTSSPIAGAKGIIPDAYGYFVSYYYQSIVEYGVGNPCHDQVPNDPAFLSPNRYDLTAELVDPSLPYRCVFQTNSWASQIRDWYTNTSAEMDRILFDHDILVCQAFGNGGYVGYARPEAWAKNIVAVGGFRHYDTECREDDECGHDGEGCTVCRTQVELCEPAPNMVCEDSWCASIGYAPDGRIKPDLTHFYENVFTTCDVEDDCYTDGVPPNPPPVAGTSFATPITCGYFGLLFQMWHEGVFPGFGGGADVFDSRPHAATARALMINTAYRYPLSSEDPNSDFERYNQGWGMADVKNLYDLRDKVFIVDESDVLTNLAKKSYCRYVPPGEPALRATLVYADPPASPSCDYVRKAINDLDLKVRSPSLTDYWGNYDLKNSNWSIPGGEANKPDAAGGIVIDTVENVFIQNPESGWWRIQVIASEVNEDGHVETPEVDVDYALVVSGVVTNTLACCLPAGGCVDATPEDCVASGGGAMCGYTCATLPRRCRPIFGPQPGGSP